MFKELLLEGLYPKGNMVMAKKDIKALIEKTFGFRANKVKYKKSSAYPNGGIINIYADTTDPETLVAADELDKLLNDEISNRKGTYSGEGRLGVRNFDTHFYYLIENLDKKYWK